jgi:hypothetical protein
MIGESLAAFSVIWGLLASLIFRRFTDRAALRVVRKRMYAHLLEIRLYSEEPGLVWNAQKALFADNLRFLALTARPVLIMAVPFALLYSPIDSIYGWRPIEVGHSAVVTLQIPEELAQDTPYLLRPPPGIFVETPPVRIFGARQISWRVRALMPVRGTLRFTLPGDRGVSRSISAGHSIALANLSRVASGRGWTIPGQTFGLPDWSYRGSPGF